MPTNKYPFGAQLFHKHSKQFYHVTRVERRKNHKGSWYLYTLYPIIEDYTKYTHTTPIIGRSKLLSKLFMPVTEALVVLYAKR